MNIDFFNKGVEALINSIIKFIPQIFISIIVFFSSLLVSKIVSRTLYFTLKKYKIDITLITFISKVLKWMIIIGGIAVIFNIFGLSAIASGIITGAGFLTIAVGFAFRDAGENFVAGFMLALSRPFEIGDKIKTGNFEGKVKEINLRNIKIITDKNEEIFIPNSFVFKNPIIKL